MGSTTNAITPKKNMRTKYLSRMSQEQTTNIKCGQNYISKINILQRWITNYMIGREVFPLGTSFISRYSTNFSILNEIK